MNTEQWELLKADLVTLAVSRPSRKQAEIIVKRIADSIIDLSQETAEEAIDEHEFRFQHEYKEDY